MTNATYLMDRDRLLEHIEVLESSLQTARNLAYNADNILWSEIHKALILSSDREIALLKKKVTELEEKLEVFEECIWAT